MFDVDMDIGDTGGNARVEVVSKMASALWWRLCSSPCSIHILLSSFHGGQTRMSTFLASGGRLLIDPDGPRRIFQLGRDYPRLPDDW